MYRFTDICVEVERKRTFQRMFLQNKKNAEKKFQQNLPGTIIGKTSENVPAEKEQGTFSLKNYKERS